MATSAENALAWAEAQGHQFKAILDNVNEEQLVVIKPATLLAHVIGVLGLLSRKPGATWSKHLASRWSHHDS